MNKLTVIGAVISLMLAGVNPSWGGPIVLLTDNFNSESIGLNYNEFANWDVTDGTVDLIGVGSEWNWFPAYGRYVDMDGTTYDAGKMTTKTTFNLNPGIYTLTFDLAGNQRTPTSETVIVRVGSLFNKSYSLDWNAPFTTFVETFTVSAATSAKLSFEGSGGDNIGMLLDNVSLTWIPAPGALLLSTVGAGFVGWLRRRITI